jgi:hypothetical protein
VWPTAQQGNGLPIQQIHTFLVRPGKGGREKLEVNGTDVPLSGSMFNLLAGIYDRSDEECNIHINFRPSADGKQQNDCRDLLTGYLSGRTLDTAKLLAERLRDTTDGRSGLGLLFLLAGMEGRVGVRLFRPPLRSSAPR